MTGNKSMMKHLLTTSLILLLLGCYRPPYNNFEHDNATARRTAVGAGVGAAVGVAVGNTLLGAAIGGTVGAASSFYRNSPRALVNQLQREDVQYVQYGNTNLLVVPTDKYFLFNSPRLNELCYPGLFNIVQLLQFYPNSTIYVAGFTDDIGSAAHKKKLTQARAEAMLTYLWANNIQAQRLSAEGYSDKHAVSDNELIHGSAQNRRLEIQWVDNPLAKSKNCSFIGLRKEFC